MNSEQFESFMHSQRELYKLYREQLQLSKQLLIIQQKIDSKLDKLISDRPLKDPDYQKALGDYQNFNWSSIDAKVLATDSDGVSSVEWNGKIYKRRSPENKFAIQMIEK